MRPPWRVPRWSAERRAVSAETAAVSVSGQRMVRLSALRLPSLLGRPWKGFLAVAWQNSDAKTHRENGIATTRPRGGGRGTTRRVVGGGLWRWRLRCRCRNFVEFDAPSPPPCAQGGPLPPLSRGGKERALTCRSGAASIRRNSSVQNASIRAKGARP